MKLTQQQIDDFNREGWLFLPELFSAEEVSFLAREAVSIYDTNRPEVWREKSGAPRTAFAAHLYNEAFGLLGAHPRMIDPVEQIFGEKVYMHQYKINAKSAFTGDVWQWHQDYGTWKRDDGMPQPRAMNIAIFLDEVMPINGPLMLVPKSQHAGDLKASHDLQTTSYPLWTLDEDTVTRLVNEGGIVAPTGKAGGMLMFHGNLVHGSAGNITPYPRKIVYLTLNAVSNYIRTPTRPDYIAHRDFTPIQTVDDDALLDSRALIGRLRNRDRSSSVGRWRAGSAFAASRHAKDAVRNGVMQLARITLMNLHHLLDARRTAGKPVRVALIGAGKFGSMFLSQVPHTPGLEVPIIVDRDVERARDACRTVGWDAARIAATTFTDDGGPRDVRSCRGDCGSHRQPRGRHQPRPRGDCRRQAYRHGQCRGRCAGGTAAGGGSPQRRRRLFAGLWRPARIDRRDGGLGAGHRLSGRRRRQRHQVPARLS